jgi:hypothetical protein
VALVLACALAALLPASPATAQPSPPRIEDVEQSLTRDPSYRVRVSAALVLGRLAKPRSVPALLRALRDVHPAVRGTAAQALGRIGDPSARGALQDAAQDGSPLVRRMAHDALKNLDRARAAHGGTGGGGDEAEARPTRPAFEVKAMGDQSRHASPALRGHMRDYLAAQLRPAGDVVDEGRPPARGYVIDGVIKSLSMSTQPTMVEVTCAVQLIISRQPTGGVFLLTTGEAIVQKPRQQFRPQQRASMELEALENAVRGASDDLLQRLAQQ